MKKRFIPLLALTMLASLFTLQGSNSSDLIETTLLEDQKGISLLDVRRSGTAAESSEMYVQYATQEDAGNTYHYIRFATAVKNATKLTYERKIAGEEIAKTGSITTVYTKISANGREMYYDAEAGCFTEAEMNNGYYWATYTIRYSAKSSYADKDITLNLYVNDSATPITRTTSLNDEIASWTSNGDGTHSNSTVTEECYGRTLEEYIIDDAKNISEPSYGFSKATSNNGGMNYLHGMCSDGKYIYALATNYANGNRPSAIVRYDLEDLSAAPIKSVISYSTMSQKFAGISYYNGYVLCFYTNGTVVGIETKKFAQDCSLFPFGGFDTFVNDTAHPGNLVDVYYNEQSGEFVVSRDNGTIQIYNSDMTWKANLPTHSGEFRITGTDHYIYTNQVKDGVATPSVRVFDWGGNEIGSKVTIPAPSSVQGSNPAPSSTNVQGMAFHKGSFYYTLVSWGSSVGGIVKVSVDPKEKCLVCGGTLLHNWTNYTLNGDGTHQRSCEHPDGVSHTEKVKCSANINLNGLRSFKVGDSVEASDFEIDGTCECGREFTGEDINVLNNTLIAGINEVTVTCGGVSKKIEINIGEMTKEPTYTETGTYLLNGQSITLPKLNDLEYFYYENNGVAKFIGRKYQLEITKTVASTISISGINYSDVSLNFRPVAANSTLTYDSENNKFILNIADGKNVSLGTILLNSTLEITGNGTLNTGKITSENIIVSSGMTLNANVSTGGGALIASYMEFKAGSIVNVSCNDDAVRLIGRTANRDGLIKAYGTFTATKTNGKGCTAIIPTSTTNAVKTATIELATTSRLTFNNYEYAIGEWSTPSTFNIVLPSGLACNQEKTATDGVSGISFDDNGTKTYLIKIVNCTQPWFFNGTVK